MLKKGLFISGVAGILWLAFMAAWLLTLNRPAVDKEALTAADNLLQAGHLAEAIDVYEQIAAQAPQSSAMYYNLGQAYYQQGDLPAAYSALQKAIELDPRDEDARQNLSLVEEALGDTYPAGSPTLITRILPSRLTINELALLALGSWLLTGFLLLTLRVAETGRRKRLWQSVLVVLFLLTITSSVALAGRTVASFSTLPAITSMDSSTI